MCIRPQGYTKESQVNSAPDSSSILLLLRPSPFSLIPLFRLGTVNLGPLLPPIRPPTLFPVIRLSKGKRKEKKRKAKEKKKKKKNDVCLCLGRRLFVFMCVRVLLLRLPKFFFFPSISILRPTNNSAVALGLAG